MAIAFMGPPETWQSELDTIRANALVNSDTETLRECEEAQREVDLLHQPAVQDIHMPYVAF